MWDLLFKQKRYNIIKWAYITFEVKRSISGNRFRMLLFVKRKNSLNFYICSIIDKAMFVRHELIIVVRLSLMSLVDTAFVPTNVEITLLFLTLSVT